MRVFFSSIILIVLIMFSFGFVGCNNVDNDGILRIHIRANSNSEDDQEIKLFIRDNVIDYIGDNITKCNTCAEVKDTLSNELSSIEKIANKVLIDAGYEYMSSAKITREYFPTRSYDGVSFPAGYYDALIIELGTAKGDNWWCVAYPPLCFVGKDSGDYTIRYKSKIVEIIERCFS